MNICKHSIVLLLTFILAACSSPDEPQLIAEYSSEEAIASYPNVAMPEPGNMEIYNATLFIEVRQVDKAAEKAILLANHFEGYLVNSRIWLQNNDKYIHLVLAVPAWRYEDMHTELLRLGELRSEHITGEITSVEEQAWGQYSYFTVQLFPTTTSIPHISLPNWRPVQTVQKAWDVFITIFGFLLDIVIWVVVVVGPFVLLGWIVQLIISKMKVR